MTTGRLALRALAPADAGPLFAASRDERFNAHLSWEQPTQLQQARDRVEALCRAAGDSELTALSAVNHDTGEWVSLLRFLPNAEDPLAVEMGYWTHPRFWMSGFTSELLRAAIPVLFDSPRQPARLVAMVTEPNTDSAGLLRKFGMREHSRGPSPAIRCHATTG